MGWEEGLGEAAMPWGAVEMPWVEEVKKQEGEVRLEVEVVMRQAEEVRLGVVEMKGQGVVVMVLPLLMGMLLCKLVLD